MPRASTKGIGGHQRGHRGKTNNWITPRHILDALGPFDLDPCACDPQPWPTAKNMWLVGGLDGSWFGRVWLNPPYGDEAETWLARLADHGNGIALIFARTETKMFQEQVFARAKALLFLCGRLTFYYPDGRPAEHNGGAPSVLIAYGAANARCLWDCSLPGTFCQPSNGRPQKFRAARQTTLDGSQ